MKDFGALMKQAQAMQQKLAEAQDKLGERVGGGDRPAAGMVKVTLKGTGELARVELDESLMAPGEGEVVADLVVAAHADAKRKLDAAQGEMMREAAGPLAGMGGLPGMPKF